MLRVLDGYILTTCDCLESLDLYDRISWVNDGLSLWIDGKEMGSGFLIESPFKESRLSLFSLPLASVFEMWSKSPATDLVGDFLLGVISTLLGTIDKVLFLKTEPAPDTLDIVSSDLKGI